MACVTWRGLRGVAEAGWVADLFEDTGPTGMLQQRLL
jgi:hypothetical protein